MCEDDEWLSAEPPLANRLFINTRPRIQAIDLSELIRLRGGEVFEFPTLEIVLPRSTEDIERRIDPLTPADWIVFTSANGVSSLVELFRSAPTVLNRLRMSKLAAIGAKTAAAARHFGFQETFVASESNSEGLGAELGAVLDAQAAAGSAFQVLLFRGGKASEKLPELLAGSGRTIVPLTVYDTTWPDISVEALKGLLTRLGIDLEDPECAGISRADAILLTSSEAIRNLTGILGQHCAFPREVWVNALGQLPAVVLGPKTAQTAREEGFREVFVAPEYSMISLVEVLMKQFSGF